MTICIIGAFGFGFLADTTGGQPVKTRNLFFALKEKYGAESIKYVETYRWTKHPMRMIVALINNIRSADSIIMLPAHNGIIVFSWVVLTFKRKNTNFYYDAVGGWLPEKLKKNKRLFKRICRFNSIWVETTSMKKDLCLLGMKNVTVIPNFKVYEKTQFLNNTSADCTDVIKVCTFSRVMKEKGIEDAIEAVTYINRHDVRIVLDIYGPVDENYSSVFNTMKCSFPEYIHYRGIVTPERSVEVLHIYDALLFPTRFFTEGIPGTIIDAYTAGVPIITTLWKNYGDIFVEGETGWGYDFNDSDGLRNTLEKLVNNRDEFQQMKKNVVEKAKMFSPEVVVDKISRIIEQ